MKAEIFYFDNPGRENTDKVLELVRGRGKELGIRKVVVASTTGETGLRACELLEGFEVIVITHTTGFREPDHQELSEENRKRILEKGGVIFTGTHAFGGVSFALRKGSFPILDLISNTLRIFGQGMKVCVEIALMACDAGLVRTDEEVIAVGGTARGADTAVVLKPAHSHDIFSLRVKEIICKPRL